VECWCCGCDGIVASPGCSCRRSGRSGVGELQRRVGEAEAEAGACAMRRFLSHRSKGTGHLLNFEFRFLGRLHLTQHAILP
jgi:hypothetical protein